MRLLELRKNKGVLQREIAEALGIAPTTYLSYERGQREPSLEMLNKLADFFGVSVDYLLGRTDEPQLFDDARVPKTEIQELYDEMTPPQQARLIAFAQGILASSDVSSDSNKRRA